jgi:hypothetical protein
VVTARAAGFTWMLRVDVADCGEGELESATLMVAVAVPTEFCDGVPAMAPVEPSMDNPPGKPLARKV